MKKIKQIVALALAVVMLFGMAGCKTKDASKSASSKDKDTFVVGFDQNFPPFGYVGDDGKFTGFDIDGDLDDFVRLGTLQRSFLMGELQPDDYIIEYTEDVANSIDRYFVRCTLDPDIVFINKYYLKE